MGSAFPESWQHSTPVLIFYQSISLTMMESKQYLRPLQLQRSRSTSLPSNDNKSAIVQIPPASVLLPLAAIRLASSPVSTPHLLLPRIQYPPEGLQVHLVNDCFLSINLSVEEYVELHPSNWSQALNSDAGTSFISLCC